MFFSFSICFHWFSFVLLPLRELREHKALRVPLREYKEGTILGNVRAILGSFICVF